MATRDTKWQDYNQAHWDERVAIHQNVELYDIEGFRAGRSTLDPYQMADLGKDEERTTEMNWRVGALACMLSHYAFPEPTALSFSGVGKC